MFKWYVTRGYPLQQLLETTYVERVLLREAMMDYIEMLNGIGGKDKGDKGTTADINKPIPAGVEYGQL